MKWFFSSKNKDAKRHHKENFCAVIVALLSVTVLYFSHDPAPAGANPNEVRFDSSSMETSLTSSNFSENSTGNQNSGELTGYNALLMQVLLLEKGLTNISKIPDYSATFFKQEKIEGVMKSPSFMQVKIRHEPFSVYMKWLEGDDPGREILYVDGQNDNEMLIKLGGVKGRMMPTLKLDPLGDMATKESRYPITTIGIKNVIKKILSFRSVDLEDMKNIDCRMIDNQKYNKRDCFCFVMNFKNKKESPDFRKGILYIDKETYFPICIKNFSWQPDGQENLSGEKLDEETLCEFYSFTNVTTEERLAAVDFEETNSNYAFRR